MSSVDDIYRLEKQLERTKPSDTEGLIDSIALLEADLDAGLVTTPTNLSPMDAGIASGRLGLDSAKNTALSAGNYLIGDDEAGAQRLKKAEVIERSHRPLKVLPLVRQAQRLVLSPLAVWVLFQVLLAGSLPKAKQSA